MVGGASGLLSNFSGLDLFFFSFCCFYLIRGSIDRIRPMPFFSFSFQCLSIDEQMFADVRCGN